MPAKSKKQQQFMGAALARKRKGKSRKGDPKMSASKMVDFASTKHSGLPSRSMRKEMAKRY